MLAEIFISHKSGSKLKQFIVKKLCTSVGRDKVCDIRVDDPEVALQHCLIIFPEEGYPATVRNLSSDSKSTYLNGKALGSADITLKDCDKLSVGSVLLELKYNQSSLSLSDPMKECLKRKRRLEPDDRKRLVAVVSPQRNDTDLPPKKRRKSLFNSVHSSSALGGIRSESVNSSLQELNSIVFDFARNQQNNISKTETFYRPLQHSFNGGTVASTSRIPLKAHIRAGGSRVRPTSGIPINQSRLPRIAANRSARTAAVLQQTPQNNSLRSTSGFRFLFSSATPISGRSVSIRSSASRVAASSIAALRNRSIVTPGQDVGVTSDVKVNASKTLQSAVASTEPAVAGDESAVPKDSSALNLEKRTPVRLLSTVAGASSKVSSPELYLTPVAEKSRISSSKRTARPLIKSLMHTTRSTMSANRNQTESSQTSSSSSFVSLPSNHPSTSNSPVNHEEVSAHQLNTPETAPATPPNDGTYKIVMRSSKKEVYKSKLLPPVEDQSAVTTSTKKRFSADLNVKQSDTPVRMSTRLNQSLPSLKVDLNSPAIEAEQTPVPVTPPNRGKLTIVMRSSKKKSLVRRIEQDLEDAAANRESTPLKTKFTRSMVITEPEKSKVNSRNMTLPILMKLQSSGQSNEYSLLENESFPTNSSPLEPSVKSSDTIANKSFGNPSSDFTKSITTCDSPAQRLDVISPRKTRSSSISKARSGQHVDVTANSSSRSQPEHSDSVVKSIPNNQSNNNGNTSCSFAASPARSVTRSSLLEKLQKSCEADGFDGARHLITSSDSPKQTLVFVSPRKTRSSSSGQHVDLTANSSSRSHPEHSDSVVKSIPNNQSNNNGNTSSSFAASPARSVTRSSLLEKLQKSCEADGFDGTRHLITSSDSPKQTLVLVSPRKTRSSSSGQHVDLTANSSSRSQPEHSDSVVKSIPNNQSNNTGNAVTLSAKSTSMSASRSVTGSSIKESKFTVKGTNLCPTVGKVFMTSTPSNIARRSSRVGWDFLSDISESDCSGIDTTLLSKSPVRCKGDESEEKLKTLSGVKKLKWEDSQQSTLDPFVSTRSTRSTVKNNDTLSRSSRRSKSLTSINSSSNKLPTCPSVKKTVEKSDIAVKISKPSGVSRSSSAPAVVKTRENLSRSVSTTMKNDCARPLKRNRTMPNVNLGKLSLSKVKKNGSQHNTTSGLNTKAEVSKKPAGVVRKILRKNTSTTNSVGTASTSKPKIDRHRNCFSATKPMLDIKAIRSNLRSRTLSLTARCSPSATAAKNSLKKGQTKRRLSNSLPNISTNAGSTAQQRYSPSANLNKKTKVYAKKQVHNPSVCSKIVSVPIAKTITTTRTTRTMFSSTSTITKKTTVLLQSITYRSSTSNNKSTPLIRLKSTYDRNALTEPKKVGKSVNTSIKRKLDALSLEKSRAAAKKLKAEPVKCLDKKKVAALLLCHKKKSPLKLLSSAQNPSPPCIDGGNGSSQKQSSQNDKQTTDENSTQKQVKSLRFALDLNTTPVSIKRGGISRQQTPARRNIYASEQKNSTTVENSPNIEEKIPPEDDIFSALYLSRKSTTPLAPLAEKPVRRLRSSVGKLNIGGSRSNSMVISAIAKTPSPIVKKSKRVLFATPIAEFSSNSFSAAQILTPGADYANVSCLKRNLETTPEADYGNVSCLKRNLETTPEADYANVSCLKRNLETTPEADYVNVSCVKRNLELTPQADYVNVSCVKRNLELTPQADYANVSCVKRNLVLTPEADYANVSCVKRNLELTPQADYANVSCVKSIFELKPPVADHRNVSYMKSVFTTSPIAKYTDATGAKQMFTVSPTADSAHARGIRELVPAEELSKHPYSTTKQQEDGSKYRRKLRSRPAMRSTQSGQSNENTSSSSQVITESSVNVDAPRTRSSKRTAVNRVTRTTVVEKPKKSCRANADKVLENLAVGEQLTAKFVAQIADVIPRSTRCKRKVADETRTVEKASSDSTLKKTQMAEAVVEDQQRVKTIGQERKTRSKREVTTTKSTIAKRKLQQKDDSDKENQQIVKVTVQKPRVKKQVKDMVLKNKSDEEEGSSGVTRPTSAADVVTMANTKLKRLTKSRMQHNVTDTDELTKQTLKRTCKPSSTDHGRRAKREKAAVAAEETRRVTRSQLKPRFSIRRRSSVNSKSAAKVFASIIKKTNRKSGSAASNNNNKRKTVRFE